MALTKRKDAPLDPFKRAVTLATRAIACDSDVEVVFSNEPAGLSGKLARLPEPSRMPTRSELATILSFTPGSHPEPARPAPSSKPWSRRVSRRSAPAA